MLPSSQVSVLFKHSLLLLNAVYLVERPKDPVLQEFHDFPVHHCLLRVVFDLPLLRRLYNEPSYV